MINLFRRRISLYSESPQINLITTRLTWGWKTANEDNSLYVYEEKKGKTYINSKLSGDGEEGQNKVSETLRNQNRMFL